jgi:hypothetical protein
MWVTVGLFFNPGHHTGTSLLSINFNVGHFKQMFIELTTLTNKSGLEINKS